MAAVDNVGSCFFKCSACSVYFATMEAALAHTKTCGSKDASSTLEQEENESTMFTCETCSGWFTSREQYMKHPCAAESEIEDEPVASGSKSSHQLQDITESQGSTSSWNKKATLKLIQEFQARKNKQEMGFFRKKEMWVQIHEEMCKQGYSFSVDQINGRWKSLMRAYRNTKDHNKKSGNSRKNFEFENELDVIYQKDPSISPEVTRSSSSRITKRPLPDINDDSDNETQAEPERKKKSTSSKSSTTKDLIETFKSYVEDQKKNQAEEREKREQMHQQKLDLMKSLISAISGSQGQGVPGSQGQPVQQYQGQSANMSQGQGNDSQGQSVQRYKDQGQSYGFQGQPLQQYQGQGVQRSRCGQQYKD